MESLHIQNIKNQITEIEEILTKKEIEEITKNKNKLLKPHYSEVFQLNKKPVLLPSRKFFIKWV